MEHILDNRIILSRIDAAAQKYPDKLALVMKEEGRRSAYTYREIKEVYIKGKAVLEKWGVQPGDRIALLSENRPEWVVSYFALRAVGATVVVLDSLLSPSDLLGLLQFSDVKGVLLSEKMHLKMEAVLPGAYILLNIQDQLASFPESAKQISPSQAVDADPAVALVLFTSGTVGNPKGVMLTESALVSNAEATVAMAGVLASDCVLCPVPLSHIIGVGTVLMSCLTIGASIVLLEKIQRETLLEAMQEEKVTILVGVPRLYESLSNGIIQKVKQKGSVAYGLFHAMGWMRDRVKSWLGFDLAPYFFKKIHQALGGSLRLIVSGGAPLPVELLEQFEQWGFTVLSGYGLSEFAPMISTNTEKERRLGSVGKVIGNSQIKIESTNPTAPGEICVKGPSLMLGYFHNPEETRSTIIDGWLHTGDLGQIDKNGFLFIKGRIKELIVTSSGKKAVPDDVERRYQKIRGVKELAIVGIRSPQKFGEDIYAAIVPEKWVATPEESLALKQEIEQAIHIRSENVPSYLRVQHVHLVREIPKTSTLKVKRSALARLIEKELYRASAGEKVIELEEEGLSAAVLQEDQGIIVKLIQVIRSEFPKLDDENVTIRAASTLEYDLGIDSLGRLDLAAAINKKWGIGVDENKIAFALTVEDLSRLIAETEKSAALKEPSPNREKETILPKELSASKMRVIHSVSHLAHWIWRIEKSGLENIPSKGGFILAPNHESHLDVLWIYCCLPPEVRIRLRSLAKKELFENPLTRFLAYECGGVPVDRGGNVQQAVSQGMELLKRENCLLIHPEGTRSRTGEMAEFHRGAAHLAILAQVPLIPVRIEGAYEIFPPKQRIPNLFDWKNGHRHAVKVSFGAPLFPVPGQTGLDAELELTKELRKRVVELKK